MKNKSKLIFLIFLLTFFIADRIHSAEIMTDKNKCISALSMRYCSDDDLDNKEVMMAKIKKNRLKYGDLKYLSARLKNDFNLVKAAVLSDPRNFKSASKRLRDNKDIVLIAVQNSCHALRAVSSDLLQDKDVAMTSVSACGTSLKYLPFFQGNKKNVLAAVSNHGEALEYASVDLKKDKEIVLAAVSNHGEALEYASVKLKEDKEIVLAAVKNVPASVKFVADYTLLDDIDIALAVLLKEPSLKEFFSKSVRSNSEIQKRFRDDYYNDLGLSVISFLLFFPYILFVFYFIRYFFQFRSSRYKFNSPTFQKLFKTFLFTLFIAFINCALFFCVLNILDATGIELVKSSTGWINLFYFMLLIILLICELPIMFYSFFKYMFIDFRKALKCILKSVFIPFFITGVIILLFDPGFFFGY
ncbi:MAG: DUF4116 domain-containing protein [Candidatus Marinamargulisbacteria bacterium]